MGKDVESCVHQDEKESATLEEAGQERVILHNVVQQGHHLLHQQGVKGE